MKPTKEQLGIGAAAAAANAVVLYLVAQLFLTPEVGSAIIVLITFVAGVLAPKPS